MGSRYGRAQEVQYFDNHYTNPKLFLQDGGPQKAYDFARKQRNRRIGISGSGEIFFGQYGYFGADLSNRVHFIAVPGPDGQYRLAASCRAFRRQVNAGNYDFLVISQFTQDSPESLYRYPIRAWIKSDPAVEEIISEDDITPQPDFVYKVKGKLSLAGCKKVGSNSAN